MKNHWINQPISNTCEVRLPPYAAVCGLRTTHAYKAVRYGWMALCSHHSLKFPDATPVAKLLEQGEHMFNPPKQRMSDE